MSPKAANADDESPLAVAARLDGATLLGQAERLQQATAAMPPPGRSYVSYAPDVALQAHMAALATRARARPHQRAVREIDDSEETTDKTICRIK